MKTIVIAGASGFVGKNLSSHFVEAGWKVLTVGRTKADATWNDQPSLIRALEGTDAVVNLAGKSVNCRFTASNVAELIRSRVETTTALGDAIALCSTPPKVWINASGASIYREQVSQANTEERPTDGEGTMAEVARQWERALYDAPTPNTRRVALRITLVLGSDGGVFPIFKTLVRFGQGGRQGSGQQMMSWIHVEDLIRLIHFILQTTHVKGPVNAAAPNAMSNSEFMRVFRECAGVRLGIPAPEALIRVGTTLIGADSELVLRGMFVASRKLKEERFSFAFPSLDAALKNLYTAK